MSIDELASCARRVVLRAAGIGGADLVSQGVRIFLIIGPIGFWSSTLLLVEIARNSFLVSLGVALALEIRRIGSLQARPVARWVALAATTVLVVVVGSALVSTDIGVRLGLAASEHSLRLHAFWNNAVVALIAVGYLTRRHESVQAARSRNLQELRLRQTRQRLVSISAQTAEARLEPQMLFDCLTRARDVYPVDMRRGDALLDNLVHYLRMTLGTDAAGASTLAQAAALAAARIDVERCESDPPMNLHVEADVGRAQFPANLLAPLVCEWLRHPNATPPRMLRLDASTDGKSLRVRLQGPCPVPTEALRRATMNLSAFASTRATITAANDSVDMEIAHA
jgi:hypothetical protein